MPTLPPPPPTESRIAAPARRRRLWPWLLGAIAVLLALPPLLVAGLAFSARDSAGLQRLAGWASHLSGDMLSIGGAQGDLLSRFTLTDIRVHTRYTDVDLSRLTLDWQPRALWQRELRIDTLALGALKLDLRPSPDEPPSPPPASLTLPLGVSLQSFTLKSLALSSTAAPVMSQLSLRLDSDGRRHRLVIDTLSTPWAQAHGEATLDGRKPFALTASLFALGQVPAPVEKLIDTRLALTGSLTELHVGGAFAAGSASGSLVATLAPFATLPYQRVRQVQLGVDHLDLAEFLASAPHSLLTLAADITPQPGKLRAAGRMALTNAQPGSLSAQRLPLSSAGLAFTIDAQSLQLQPSHIDAAGGRITLGGGIREQKLALDASLAGIDAAEVVDSYHSAIDGTLSLRGTLSEPAMRAALQDGPRRLDMEMALSGIGAARQLRIPKIAFHEGNSRLDASGQLSLVDDQRFTARAAMAHLDLSRYSPAAPQTDLNARLNADGAITPLTLKLALDLLDSRLAGESLTGKGKLTWQDARLSDVDIGLLAAGNRLAAKGAFGRRGDVLDFRLDAPRLASFGKGFAGKAQGQGRLVGTLDAPQVDATLKADGVATPFGIGVRHLDLSAKVARAAAAPLLLKLNAAGIEAAGQRIDSAMIDLDGSRQMHRLRAAVRGRIADQQLDATLALRGGLDDKALRWRGRVEQLENRGVWRLALAAPAELDLAADQGHIGRLQIGVLDARLDLAETRWAPGGVIVSRGSATRVDVGQWLGKLPSPPPVRTDLVLGADWDIRIAERLQGRFRIERSAGDLTVTDRDLARPIALALSAAHLEGELAGDRIQARATLRSTQFGQADLEATSRVPRRDGVWRWAEMGMPDYHLSANMPSLKWASVFAGPTSTVDGRLALDLRASGSGKARRLSGSFDGAGLSYRDAELGVAARDGQFHVTLADRRLLLSGLEFTGGRGKMTGSGWLGFSERELSEGLLALQFEHFDALARPERNLTVSGGLQARLEPRGVVIDGKLNVDKGQMNIPKGDKPKLGDDVIVVGRTEAEARKRKTYPYFLDVMIDLGSRLKLSGRGLSASLGGAIRVRATPTEPLAATGSVRVTEGAYRAYGQDLSIDHGVVTFQGPIDNPGLDILAVRKGLAVEAGVQVSGTVNRPLVRLVSSPNVSDTEKLAWLVLGKPTLSGGSEDADVLFTAASVLLSDADAVPVQQQIANAVGLDEISVSSRTTSSTTGSTGGFSYRGGESDSVTTQVVTLGKRLSDKLYLSYEQGLADATQTVKLTYQLSRRWSAVARAGDDNALDFYYTLFFDTPSGGKAP